MPIPCSPWRVCVPAGLVLLSASLRAADIAAAVAGTSTNGFRALVAADRTAEPVLAPASREGEIRLKQFKHDPSLKVDLWAAEPMLANPVAFSVDERGRVFTSETYRYRSSVLDIRHYMFMLEDDLASRSIEDRLANIRKWFGPEGERALSTETEVIRLVEDTNGDGVADRSSVYADGFRSPLSGIASGVLARNGEVWVTEIPSLWKFRAATAAELDTLPKDQPGLTVRRTPERKDPALTSQPRAGDRKVVAEELLSGFGVRFSFTGHDLHGLKLGPDGRLYFSCGDRGAHLVTREGTVIDLPDEGAVFRCEPDGSRLEVVHRGLRNPQELAFNEFGDLFTGDNDSDQGDRERWVQVIEGADSGWRVGHQHAPLGNAGMWNLERLWVPHFPGQAAYILPPIANIGDGPSGLVFDATHRYGKGGAAPAAEARRDAFLLAYFKGTSAKSGIDVLTVEPRGAGYALVGHDEFLWNSLVPDVDLAPDGAVFFADWHEGWPKSNKGRLYRAYRPDVIADPVMQRTAKLLGEGMTNRTETTLLDLLAFPDMRVRQEAQFELAARGMASFPGLKRTALSSTNRFARLHALWGIGQILRPLPPDAGAVAAESLLPLLGDADPEVVRAMAGLAGEARLMKAQPAVLELFAHGNPRVASAAVAAYSRFYGSLGAGAFRYAGSPVETALVEVRQAVNDAAGTQLSAGPAGARILGPLDPVRKALDAGAGSDPVFLSSAVRLLTAYETSGPRGRLMAWLQQTGSPSRPVRMAVILALRRGSGVGVDSFLSDADPLLVLEAARAIHDVPVTNALPALAALAEPARLDALLRQFAALPAETPPQKPDDLNGAIRDVRADQPLPWGDAPIDSLTPMLLRVVNANVRIGTPEAAARLATVASRTDLPVLIRTEALQGLASWAQPFPRDRIVGTYRPLPPRDPAPAREALAGSLRAIAAFQPPPALTPEQEADVERAKAANPDFQLLDTRYTTSVPDPVLSATAEAVLKLAPADGADFLFRMVASQSPAPARATALRCLADLVTQGGTAPVRFRFEGGRVAVDNPGGNPEEFKKLWMLGNALQVAGDAKEEALRLEASRVRARLNPEDAVGQIAGKLAGGSIAEQQAAYATLGDLKSEAADALLVESLDRLMKRDIANEVMLDLVLAAGKRTAPAVKSRLAAYQDWKLPKDHLSPYRETLQGGDAARGRKLFYEQAAVACTRCHQIGGDGGGNAGPKLDGVASRNTREYLLESIVAPNQQVVQGFESAMITLRDGQTYAGVVKSETDTELVVVSPEEGDVTLKKANVQTREKGLSGMPEGLAALLSPTELRDLIEFLGTLR